MLFNDRFDAAYKLMHCLKNYNHQDGLVFAIPGGGVPVGYYISKDYGFPLELLLTKKIKHPDGNPLSIGAASLTNYFVNKKTNASESYIKQQVTQIRKTLKNRHKEFLNGYDEINAKNKVVFIVDDGAATGNTLLAGIHMIKAKKPKKIVVAIPVAPEQTITMLQKHADDVICFHTLKNMVPVDINYLYYPPVSDTEIHQLLKSTTVRNKVA